MHTSVLFFEIKTELRIIIVEYAQATEYIITRK